MKTQLFNLRNNKLEAIEQAPVLAIGTKVIICSAYMEQTEGAIIEADDYNYKIVRLNSYNSGFSYVGKNYIQPFSKKFGIGTYFVDNLEIVNQTTIDFFLEKALAADKKRAEEAQALKLANEKEIAELPSLYPNLTPIQPYDSKQTKRNLVALLKENFPKVKFSIKTERHGACNISWTNGPIEKDVDLIANLFCDSKSSDCGDYRDLCESNFNKVFGGYKYVFTNRKMSDEIKNLVGELKSMLIENQNFHQDAEQVLYKVFATTKIDQKAEKFAIVRETNLEADQFYKIIETTGDKEKEPVVENELLQENESRCFRIDQKITEKQIIDLSTISKEEIKNKEKSISKIVQQLKEESQDLEFYPTTNQIIELFFDHLNANAKKECYGDSSISFLEIGAGNGKVFKVFDELSKKAAIDREKRGLKHGVVHITEKFAIEKSEILLNLLSSDISIVGTDFFENTLIDKKVDVIFSNPPYSQFEAWSAKIIKEAFCKEIYLVIPQRWENSKEIQEAIKKRNASVKILDSFDFLEADRAARAKVHLLHISLVKNQESYKRKEAQDPFDLWFEEEFKIQADKKDDYNFKRKKSENEFNQRKETITNEVAAGRDLVQVLTSLYQRDLAKLISTYQKLGEIDAVLLKELDVNLESVKEALKMKIKGLKRTYWNEIFDRLDKIKERLCSKQRQKLYSDLTDSTSIDFTQSNIYAVVIWIIKNANKYYDQQLVELYKNLSEKENIKNYKSNKRVWAQDRWNYNKEEKSHYTLDYRMIYSNGYWETSYSGNGRISERSKDLINDLMTVATNLGFDGQSCLLYPWQNGIISGEKVILQMRPNWQKDATVKTKTFAEVRFYQNGNIHIKLDTDFVKAFNIEAARLLGWIQSPQDAVNEFSEENKVSEKEASKFFKGNFEISTNNSKTLLLN